MDTIERRNHHSELDRLELGFRPAQALQFNWYHTEAHRTRCFSPAPRLALETALAIYANYRF